MCEAPGHWLCCPCQHPVYCPRASNWSASWLCAIHTNSCITFTMFSSRLEPKNPCRKSDHVSFSRKIWIYLSPHLSHRSIHCHPRCSECPHPSAHAPPRTASSFLHNLVVYLCIWLLRPPKSSFYLFGSFLVLDHPICQRPASRGRALCCGAALGGRLLVRVPGLHHG